VKDNNASMYDGDLNRNRQVTASVSTTPDSTLPSYSISVFGLALTNCTSSGIVSSREYDALGRTIASTDGRGNTTTLSYDAQGRVSWSEDALGNRTTLVIALQEGFACSIREPCTPWRSGATVSASIFGDDDDHVRL
jgi:YD repeat-containing protein